MNMDSEMLADLQVKVIAALMTKLGLTEITLMDDDVKAAMILIGSENEEIQIAYNYRPYDGMLSLKMYAQE